MRPKTATLLAMPELPEVETVRRAIAPILEGRRIRDAQVRRRDLRVPVAQDFADRIRGREVTKVSRRAKYLLIELADGTVLLVHLGMSGRLSVLAPPVPAPGPHDHVDLELETGQVLRFCDARRFGLMELATLATLDAHPRLAGLGPDPLTGGLDGALLTRLLAGRRGPVKPTLMDQRVLAGMGNIYACEALFRARVSPRRKASSVTGARADRLARTIREVLAEAVAAGGSSLRDHVLPDGGLGYFQHRFAVYGREGEACPGCDCDRARSGGIRRLVQSGRSTFYCATRQR